jgi:SPP1 gp7 family putative phage head morphogenesis protein
MGRGGMTASEWDKTEWGGTVVAEPMRSVVPEAAAKVVAKAAMGWESTYTADHRMVTDLSRSPLRRMRSEQALYWSHPWILSAENAVTRKVAGLPWHLEDDEQDEVEDTTPDPRLRQIRDLLEKPQANITNEQERQVGLQSWTNLITVTSRHLGLCGMTHWYLDQMDSAGIPRAILYINPARLFPLTTDGGNLIRWVLDPKDDEGRGGLPLERREVLTFYLQPPDWGAWATGNVHAAYLKAQISTLIDTHSVGVFGTGGRLAGILAPKEGTINDEQYSTLQREARSIQETPDSAKRLHIVRGPVEFHRTAGTLVELQHGDVAKMTRDDIFVVWGVPGSQAAIPSPGGLNSGETKKWDEPVLMQGPVHDRVRVLRETIQLGLLDRFAATGSTPQLVIEEPSFDDKKPAYELAQLAKELPLTRNQRLEIIGLDPLPEYGPDGEPLGLAIDLPVGLTTVGQGEEPEGQLNPGRFGKAPQPKPEPVMRVLPPQTPLLPASTDEQPAKAKLNPRDALLRRYEPQVRRAVADVLAEQRQDIVNRVVLHGAQLTRKPTDRKPWWPSDAYWDERLEKALKRSLGNLASTVTVRVADALPAKADPFTESVLAQILASVGKRIRGINKTTRDAIAAIVEQAFGRGLAPIEVADLIEDATAFNPARAETIARTETAIVYNEAAIQSYREYGVEQVQAIDGDEDEECAARNGQIFTVDEAMEIQDHPNGTLDWAPVL